MLLIDEETPADVVAVPDALRQPARRELAVGRTRRSVVPSR